MLTPQQPLTTIINKPTITTRETLIVIPITSFTTTTTPNNIITSSDNGKR